MRPLVVFIIMFSLSTSLANPFSKFEAEYKVVNSICKTNLERADVDNNWLKEFYSIKKLVVENTRIVFYQNSSSQFSPSGDFSWRGESAVSSLNYKDEFYEKSGDDDFAGVFYQHPRKVDRYEFSMYKTGLESYLIDRLYRKKVYRKRTSNKQLLEITCEDQLILKK